MKQLFILKSITVLLLSLLIGLCSKPSLVLGQYYGGSSNSPALVVDKFVRPINDNIFYDNLSSTQKTFVEGDQIEFKIKIENKGNINLENIKVVDYLPKYLTLLYFPGIKNISNNSIESIIINLNPGEIKEYIIRARITDVPSSSYSNQLIQSSNKACASNDRVSDCDTAKYFIGLSSAPATGNNDLIIKSLIILTISAVGVSLKKLARGY